MRLLAVASLAMAVALQAWALPAWAGEQPLTTPSRDVDVIYRIAGPDAPLEQRIRWGVTLGKMRVDPPSPGLFVVIDTKTHAMQTVREGDRSVLMVEGRANIATGLGSGDYTRRGEAVIAGLGCTQWETRDTGGHMVLACLTTDGVLLGVQTGDMVLLQATEVHFTPQSEAVFRIPADYRRIITAPVSQKRP